MFKTYQKGKTMSPKAVILTLSILILGYSGVQAAQMDMQKRLTQADAYRMLGGSTKSLIEVSQLEGSELKKMQVYEVYSKQGKGSLVLFKSTSDSGQKMLMLEDKFWMFMPKSRRPIRITPMQKLLGDASAGDISALSWRDAYEIASSDAAFDHEGVTAVKLSLKSAVKGNTYDRIELILSLEDNFPLKADLYLKSGKKAKIATFEKGQRDGNTIVASMKLKDSIQNESETVIAYKSTEPKEIADKLFNPSFLIKNNLESF